MAAAGSAGLAMGPAYALPKRSAEVVVPVKTPSGFPIHLFSKHLQFLGYEEMAEAMAVAGLNGADLTVRPGGHVLPENVGKDLPAAAKAIRKAGLELTMITTRITSAGEEHTEAVLDTAAQLGIQYYRMGYYKYDPAKPVLETLDHIRKEMEGLARLNEKYGLHGAYQNHAGSYFGAEVWDLFEVMRDLDPRWSGCQYDLHHAMVENGGNWTRSFDLVKPWIRCMVAKDFKWTVADDMPKRKSVPLGMGIVDFESYFQMLHRDKIAGPISLHIEYPLYPDKNAPVQEKTEAAIRTIRENLNGLQKYLN